MCNRVCVLIVQGLYVDMQRIAKRVAHYLDYM